MPPMARRASSHSWRSSMPGLCIAEQQAVVDRYLKPFCKELDRQIMSDGGHISRNPAALVELLLDLLPLRQCFMARDRVPPKQLSDAIDRAMPMVRFFRLGDGTMVRFNGGGATATDSLATVLAYDDTGGAPLRCRAEFWLCAHGARGHTHCRRRGGRPSGRFKHEGACRVPLLRDELRRACRSSSIAGRRLARP